MCLKARGHPQVLILDVRHWNVSDKKIKGQGAPDPTEIKPGLPICPRTRKSSCADTKSVIVRVAKQLIDMGFKQVWGLKGGWVEGDKAK